MSFRYTLHLAAAATILLIPASKLYAQDQCQCAAPGGEDSRIASAIGGGLFAGLIAAVIPFHHAAALASAPPAAPIELTTMTDSTDIAPSDSTRPRQLASIAAGPTGADAGAPRGGAPISRTSNGESVTPLASITPGEAEADGMIAPKTATILPALTMIGIGAILLGIFFIRVRRPRLRSH
jgi:hypothetical protein